jgi:hypothetical protein
VEAAKEPGTTQEYLEQFVYGVKDHQEYLDLIGAGRLEELKLGGVQ